MRSIWTGAISFGLVNIPVRLYSAVSTHDINFDMLEKDTLSPIRYARISKDSGKEVEYKNIVKGYEYRKGDYIIVSDSDFEKASPEKYKAINIVSFVSESEIDSVYFEKPYYLEPDKGAGKPYALLLKALQKSKKVAIAEFMLRNRERVGIIKASDGGALVLNQIRYYDEVRDPKDLNLPNDKVNPKEVEMAMKLVDQLTEEFHPENFKDHYVEKIKKVIEAKAKGKEIKMPATKKPDKQVKDLMEILRESLKTTKKKAA